MIVATDGSCSHRTRIGAWAWVAEDGEYRAGCVLDTTNNIMELTAIQKALLLNKDLEIIYDSRYAVNSITKWGHSWRADPEKAAKKKNTDLVFAIMDLLEAREKRGLLTEFTWQKAHTGEVNTLPKLLNHYADRLCSKIRKVEREAEMSGVQFKLRERYLRLNQS